MYIDNRYLQMIQDLKKIELFEKIDFVDFFWEY